MPVDDVAMLKHGIRVGRAFCIWIWCFGHRYDRGDGTSFRKAFRCVQSIPETCGVLYSSYMDHVLERGNRKKAISHLRVKPLSKTYHFIILRSGLWFGLALPAIAGGFYLCMFLS